MVELIQKGGIILVLIIGLAFIATVIIIERLIYFRRIRIDEEKILFRLKATLEKGHYDEAISICEGNPSPITNLMKVGLEYKDHSEERIKDAIVSAANMEIPRLERYLSALGTIANIATLLGPLGTVTGNIHSFGVLGTMGAVGDPSLLAKGIAEALLTTAAGLIVSIPTIVFYNYLVNRVNHMIIRLENRVTELVLILVKTKGKDPS
ncbi:MAG: MotA/TolQ/ExbB proton channel family protein [Spirochaetes bacterium]|nr:MotA/TolQ/ExbB proton channel family protein [Spirochaetota bacterium]